MSILAYMVVEKSLTKNFIIQRMVGKKIGQIQGKISRGRLFLNPTIYLVVINLQTKFEHSSLHGCGEIFYEKFYSSKCGRKEKWTNTGMKKQKKGGSQSHDKSSSTCIPNMSILACMVVEKSFTKIFYLHSVERKKNWTNTGKNKQD